MGLINWTLRLSVVVMPLVLLPDVFRSGSVPKAFILSFVVVALAVGCFFAGRTRSLKSVPFVLPLGVFLAITVLQTARSMNPDMGLYLMLLQVCGGFIGFVVAGAIDKTQVLALLRFTAWGAIATSIIGVLEYWGVSWAMLPSAGRPSATFGFRNIAGMYLAVVLPFCTALIFEKQPRDRLLGYGAASIMVVFLIYTRTRGAWVGVFFALLVGIVLLGICRQESVRALWQQVRQRRFGVVVVVGLCVLAAGFPPRFSDQNPSRIDEKKQDLNKAVASLVQPGGDRGRLNVWYHTLEMIVDHPLFGVGLANWAALYPEYDRGDVLGIVVAPKRPHNDFLWIWAELGTLGLLAFLWVLLVVFRQMWRTLTLHGIDALPVLCAGLGALALLIHGCFSFPREQAAALLPFWIALGIAGRAESEVLKCDWHGYAIFGIGLVAGVCGVVIYAAAVRFDYHFAKSLMAQSVGRADVQVAQARKAREYGLFDHRVLLIEGEGLRAQGDTAAVVAVYQSYLNYQPFLPAIHNNLGRIYEDSGDYVSAEKSYVRGIKTFAGDGVEVLKNNLAAVYKKQGRVEDALAIYESASYLPAEGYLNLGLLYAERGELEKAAISYRQALVIDSEMTIAFFSLAGVEMLQGQLEDAAQHYEAFLERWHGAPDYVRDAEKRLRQIYPVLGDRLLRAGKAFEAAHKLERLIQLDAATPEVYNNLALIYGRRAQHKEAIANAQQALKLDPGFAPAYFTLAMIYDEAAQIADALKHYRVFLELGTKNDRLAQQAKVRIEELTRP